MSNVSCELFSLARHGSAKMSADLIELGHRVVKMEKALKMALEINQVGLIDFDEYGLSCDDDIVEVYKDALDTKEQS